MSRRSRSDLPPELFELFDRYVHGDLSRREFLDEAARFAVGGLGAAASLDRLKPDYALARQVPEGDERIRTEYVTYSSPDGHGEIRAPLLIHYAEDDPGVDAGWPDYEAALQAHGVD